MTSHNPVRTEVLETCGSDFDHASDGCQAEASDGDNDEPGMVFSQKMCCLAGMRVRALGDDYATVKPCVMNGRRWRSSQRVAAARCRTVAAAGVFLSQLAACVGGRKLPAIKRDGRHPSGCASVPQ